ncbi:MAG: PAS domain S-box protein [Nitratireductor sp.]
MKLSLGAILAIWLAGLQFLAVLSVVFFNYLTSERVLFDHANKLISEVGRSSIQHSKGFLEPAIKATNFAKNIIETDLISAQNPQSLEKIIFQQLRIVPQFSGMFYGDEQGNFVYVMRTEKQGIYRTKIIKRQNSQIETKLIWRDDDYKIIDEKFDATDKYDPRQRPWYVGAKQNKDFVWTDPYIFFSSQRPGITAAAPITTSQSLSGVIGVDIEIQEISQFLSSLEIGTTGIAMALSNNASVIAHPNSALIKAVDQDGKLEFVKIDKIKDPIAFSAFGNLPASDKISSDNEIKSEFVHNNNDYVSVLIKGESHALPWNIAIYAPLGDFIGGIANNRNLNIWIAFLIALVTGLVGLKIAGKINRPVRDFAAMAERVSSGERPSTDALETTYPELEGASETLVSEVAQRKRFEREYGLTFDLASRGMAQISSLDGRFIRVNSQLADMLGYSVEELMKKSFSKILHPDDVETFISIQHTILEDFEYNQEMKCVKKNGEIIWLRVNAILIRDEQGQPLYAVATMHDRTSQKESEVKINTLRRDLSHFARINMLGQMATGLAHELNQPLTAITQNVDAALLTMEQRAENDPELKEILNDMDRQAHHGADIIRALRGFVRKDEGSKSSFDINELIEQTLQLVLPDAKEHSISVKLSKPNSEKQDTDVLKVYANRVQIAQVLMNLIRNAIEAVDNEALKTKEILVEAEQNKNDVVVSVIDSGYGVDPSIDIFSQLETTKVDGLGLGLSLCKTLVKENDGKVWYDFDEKSKFNFTIPKTPVSKIDTHKKMVKSRKSSNKKAKTNV